ncbi:High-affinity branched-chain amino acid transport system permease protein LivH [Xylophilus ampelinus]|jgi:branched-chain amino acid transport system permease protein|uniref:branched-chain amino acid ABC transporter permease n=1 Tax=Comamonadaceae TaxID=80864 RepID=UPI000A77BF6B|nr:branched-chain amino acid ABC transporter permease [Xenophilus azovorans]MBN8747264.1 branched-chain amino acid ABC transporter permease [Variovorax sp.]VTY39550.1 High-affinity branched-chain amino acid transport system permease protein LivH [Xylophilus ampelinus]
MIIEFLNYALNGALLGLLYALVAMGFVVIYRASKVFNMATGEMLVLGAFLVWWAVASRGLHPALGIAAALVIAVVVGLAIERLFFRRLIGESVFSMIMVTIGLLILTRGLVLVIWGPQERAFPALIPLAPLIVGEMIIPRPLAAAGVVAVVFALALHWFFNRSRTGLAMSAVAEDHQIALSMGISVRRSIAFAWALGGVLSVISSIVYLSGKSLTFLSSEIGFAALPVALLAGLESIRGLLLAGLIVGVVQGLTSAYIDPLIGGNAASVVPYIFMLVVLAVRPNGMFGWKRIERV